VQRCSEMRARDPVGTGAVELGSRIVAWKLSWILAQVQRPDRRVKDGDYQASLLGSGTAQKRRALAVTVDARCRNPMASCSRQHRRRSAKSV
jgi:hypothetical protein